MTDDAHQEGTGTAKATNIPTAKNAAPSVVTVDGEMDVNTGETIGDCFQYSRKYIIIPKLNIVGKRNSNVG